MRRRWEVGEDFGMVLGAIWMFGWVPIFLAIGAIWGNGLGDNSHVPVAGFVFLAVWFGPPIIGGLAWLIGVGAWTLWNERPRRVTEPVTEDLRKVPR